MAPSLASQLNTAFGEDEIGESDARTGFDATSMSGDAGLALGESDSLAAPAGGPVRDGSAPRDVRTLTIVGVTPRISPTGMWTKRDPSSNNSVGQESARCRIHGHVMGYDAHPKTFDYLNQIPAPASSETPIAAHTVSVRCPRTAAPSSANEKASGKFPARRQAPMNKMGSGQQPGSKSRRCRRQVR